MHLNIDVRLRDLDTHGNINRETRHLYIRMPNDEPANRFIIYNSMIKSSLSAGAPWTINLNKISLHIIQSGEQSL